jgi:hypothetical protein
MFFFLFFSIIPLSASASIAKAPNNLGLVGYWPMNEGTSTIVGDFSGNNNFGTTSNMSNPATASSGWTSGKHGKALAFDGNDDYITMAPSMLSALRGGEYTVSFWEKDNFTGCEFLMDTTNTGDTQRFFISLNGGNWAGNQKAIGIGENGNTDNLGNANSIPSTGWNFITITLSVIGNASTGYVNGVQTGAQGYVADTFGGTGRKFIVGARYDTGTCPYNGKLDDFRIYNRVLSLTEINNLYKSGAVQMASSPTNRIANGLVGYWTFDGKDTDWVKGLTYDLSGSNNTGTLSNMSTSTSPVAGKFGQALKFNGTASYVAIPDASNVFAFPNTTFTVTGWAKHSSALGTNNQLVNKDGISAGWFVYFNASKISGFLKDNTSNQAAGLSSSSDIPGDGNWHHFAVIFTTDTSVSANNNVTIYVDGVLDQGTIFRTGLPYVSPTAVDLRLGTRRISNVLDQFNGLGDDIRIYNRALTATEVKQLYNMGSSATVATSPTTRLTNGLVGYWTFDGKNTSWTSNTTNDISGNNNTGTMTNMSTTTTPVAGKSGQAFSFDGDSSFISVPHSASLDVSSAYTFSSWVYFDSRAACSCAGNLIGKNTDGGYGDSLSIGRSSGGGDIIGGNIRLDVVHNQVGVFSNWVYPVDTWTYVTVVWDGANVYFYKDGILADTPYALATAPITNTGTLRIGKSVVNWFYSNFLGKMDDIRLYNRALSASEVKQLAGKGITYTPPVPGPDSTNITIDRTTNGGSATTFAHTVGSGSNRYLTVGTSYWQGSVTGVTYSGQVMTKLGASANASDNAEIWGLLNPPTGTANVVITGSGVSEIASGATSWTGVNQSTPTGIAGSNSGASGNPATSVTTTPGDMVFGEVYTIDGVTQTATQNLLWKNTYCCQSAGGASNATSTGVATTLNWTLSPSTNSWRFVAIPLHQ